MKTDTLQTELINGSNESLYYPDELDPYLKMGSRFPKSCMCTEFLTTVAVSVAVACAVSVAVFRTGSRTYLEGRDGHALLVDAEGPVGALGALRRQTRIDLVQS